MLDPMPPLPPSDPRVRESATMIPVYGQLPFVPERATGCDIITIDGLRKKGHI